MASGGKWSRNGVEEAEAIEIVVPRVLDVAEGDQDAAAGEADHDRAP